MSAGSRHGAGWRPVSQRGPVVKRWRPEPKPKPHARLTAIVPARPESLAELHTAFDLFFLAAEGAGARIPVADRLALVTAAAEVAANIVDHACPGVPNAQMSVALECDGGTLEARFEDPGRPYRPGATPEDEAVDDERDTPHLGLGLVVAREAVDALEYARQGGRNCWRLVRQAAAGPRFRR